MVDIREDIVHVVKYTFNELKIILNNGEVYRNYPKDPSHAYLNMREFLNSDIIKDVKIEASNLGNIKINNEVVMPYEKEKGYYYVKILNKIEYLVYRLVAETWCEFQGDTAGWQVHHIIDNGLLNKPENLIWVKENIHLLLHR
jgi:DNA-directed RNA polymerase subunit H (RpoH/RPB5)